MATVITELRRYDFSCVLARCGMAISDDRRERFKAWMAANDYTLYRVAKDTGVNYNTLRSYVGDGTDKITESLKGSNEAQIARAYRLTVEDIFGSEDEDDAPSNHLRAWREFKFLTVDELAQAVGTTPANIELLENQPSPPSAKWLRRLAPALDTTVGAILDFAPGDVDSAALEGTLSVRRGGGGMIVISTDAEKKTGTKG